MSMLCPQANPSRGHSVPIRRHSARLIAQRQRRGNAVKLALLARRKDLLVFGLDPSRSELLGEVLKTRQRRKAYVSARSKGVRFTHFLVLCRLTRERLRGRVRFGRPSAREATCDGRTVRPTLPGPPRHARSAPAHRHGLPGRTLATSLARLRREVMPLEAYSRSQARPHPRACA